MPNFVCQLVAPGIKLTAADGILLQDADSLPGTAVKMSLPKAVYAVQATPAVKAEIPDAGN